MLSADSCRKRRRGQRVRSQRARAEFNCQFEVPDRVYGYVCTACSTVFPPLAVIRNDEQNRHTALSERIWFACVGALSRIVCEDPYLLEREAGVDICGQSVVVGQYAIDDVIGLPYRDREPVLVGLLTCGLG